MRYFKIIDDDNNILSIGKGNGGIEIDLDEYNTILNAIKNKPTLEGYDYHIKNDLTYEPFEVVQEIIEDIQDYEALYNKLKSDYDIAKKKAETADKVRAYLVEKRDEAILATTKALYQAIIDLFE